MEFGIKNAILFILALAKVKHLGINPTKYVWDSLWGKSQNLIYRIKELCKWRDISCSWLGKFNNLNKLVLTNLTYRFNAIPIKVPANCFVVCEKLILKFTYRPIIANITLKEKIKVGGLTLPSVRTYYGLTVTKTVWYWQKNGSMDSIESQEIYPHK